MKTLIKTLQALSVLTVLLIAVGITYAAKTYDKPAQPTTEQVQANPQPTPDNQAPISLSECPDQMC